MTDLTGNEIWADTGIPYIQVSTHGRIQDTWTGNIRKATFNQGRMQVQVRHATQSDRLYVLSVAKLVLIAFVGHDPDPTRSTPLHLDGDLTNCRIDNLVWSTLHEAKRHYGP